MEPLKKLTIASLFCVEDQVVKWIGCTLGAAYNPQIMSSAGAGDVGKPPVFGDALLFFRRTDRQEGTDPRTSG